MKKRITIKPKSKRYKKRTRLKGFKKRVNKKKNIATIPPKARRIFDAMTTDKEMKKQEVAGEFDFEKDKQGKIKLQKWNTTLGGEDEIEFESTIDSELDFHSHPESDVLIFSTTDMDAILNDKQQGEILFRMGEALVLVRPKKINKEKFLKEYDKKLWELNTRNASRKDFVKELSFILKKYSFKLQKFKKGKEIKIPLRRVV